MTSSFTITHNCVNLWGYCNTLCIIHLPSQAKKKVIAAALGFGPGWQECGLPHPVPIACVGCGDCDATLLQIIAKITKGMYVIVGNISELSTFFRRQVGIET